MKTKNKNIEIEIIKNHNEICDFGNTEDWTLGVVSGEQTGNGKETKVYKFLPAEGDVRSFLDCAEILGVTEDGISVYEDLLFDYEKEYIDDIEILDWDWEINLGEHFKLCKIK